VVRRAVLLAHWLPRLPGDLRASRRTRPDGFDRVYFAHVRKSGGTSLANAFLALGGEDPAAVAARMAGPLHATRTGPYVVAAHDVPVLRRGAYFFGWSHHPVWHVAPPPGSCTVTVLRDPVSRVLSLYRYLADPDSDRGQAFPAPAEERGWATDGLGAFLDRAHDFALRNQLWLFSPRADPEEAAAAVRRCTVWFTHEHFADGLEALAGRLGLPLALRRDRPSAPGPGPTAAERDRLRERLADEYALLDALRADPGPGLVGPPPGTA
jgi:hypothetical protein